MSSGGTPLMGTISIASNVFILDIGGGSLSYVAQNGTMTVSYKNAADEAAIPIATQRSAAAFSGGIVPLDVGGGWTFSDPNQPAHTCNVNVSGAEVDGTCNHTVGTWPSVLAEPTPAITYIAHKTSSGTSQFGDLSGAWTLYESDDMTPAGTVTFSGSTISAAGVQMDNGSATLTFNGTGDASGSTSGGIEYSGHRR
jgi:hypothetical protein